MQNTPEGRKPMSDQTFHYIGRDFTYEQMRSFLYNQKFKGDERIKTVVSMIGHGGELLDVGCATGVLSKYYTDFCMHVQAIDILDESIRIAKLFYPDDKITYEKRDLIKNPFMAGSFDTVLFLETIEHVHDPASFLKEFYRILKPEGKLILSTPNATSLKNLLYAVSYRKKESMIKLINSILIEEQNMGTQSEHIYNWDMPTIIRLLIKCGFSIERHAFVGTGPIAVHGKTIIPNNSTLLDFCQPLKSTHVILARKHKTANNDHYL